MRRALLAIAMLVLGGCAPRTALITSDHPASPEAATGRLAGPPPALRPGVVSLTDPPAPDVAPTTGHEHHDMSPPDSAPPKAPEAEPPKSETPNNPAPKTTAPKTTTPKRTAPKPAAPKKTPEPKPSPEPKPTPKPAPTPPDPHQGHDMGHH